VGSQEKPGRVLVVTHPLREDVAELAEKLAAALRSAGVAVRILTGEMRTLRRPDALIIGEAGSPGEETSATADLVLALGGDGTMLRALRATLGTETPVFGVKYGRVGFLTSVDGDRLEEALERIFAGDYRVVELCTLSARTKDGSQPAVNDIVVTSSQPGRMVELGWEIGGEELGSQPCDGMICCTPSGSTAYNLSNGGPVMMWGLEAMAMTFVAPHSLHARPLVVPRGLDLTVVNRSAEHALTVLVDGRAVGELVRDESLSVALGDQTCRLALLPEVTFFGRYHEVFP
jgi:NAD+ kinase